MALISRERIYQFTCDRAHCPHYATVTLPDTNGVGVTEARTALVESYGWTVSGSRTVCGEHGATAGA